MGWTYTADYENDPDNEGLETEAFIASSEAYANYTLASSRISLVDVTSMNEVMYRHILLVEPDFTRAKSHVSAGGVPTLVESPVPGYQGQGTFRAVHTHAGGVVWYGRWLYVCGGSTVWVFDMEDIRDISAQNPSYASTRKMGWDAGDRRYHAWGYRYILPAVHKFSWTDESDPDPEESWPDGGPFASLGLDRSTEPHRLLNIQYCSEGSGKYDDNLDHSIVMFWDLDARTGLPVMAHDFVFSSDAAYAGQWYIQGVHAAGEQVWMCSSSATNLLRMRTIDASPWETHEWAWGGEGLTYSASTDHLWNVTEFRKNRICFCVFRGDVGGP